MSDRFEVLAKSIVARGAKSQAKWTKKQLEYDRVDRLGRKSSWRRERMELDFRKKSRRDRIMLSKTWKRRR